MICVAFFRWHNRFRARPVVGSQNGLLHSAVDAISDASFECALEKFMQMSEIFGSCSRKGSQWAADETKPETFK